MKAGEAAAGRAKKRTIIDLYREMADLKIVRCIKNSLIMLLPVLLTGAFALFFRALPIPAYQTFLKSFCRERWIPFWVISIPLLSEYFPSIWLSA